MPPGHKYPFRYPKQNGYLMDGLGFLLVLFLTITLIIGLPIVLSIVGYRWVKRKGYAKAAVAIPILILGTLLYFVYTAFYPNESFYIEEFETNTTIPFPASGVFLKKDATYPDIHGDYTSKAIIQLSEEDYRFVYQKLTVDQQFRIDTSSHLFLGDTIAFLEAKNIDSSKLSTILIGGRTAQFKVGFVKDGRTIIFERHSS